MQEDSRRIVSMQHRADGRTDGHRNVTRRPSVNYVVLSLYLCRPSPGRPSARTPFTRPQPREARGLPNLNRRLDR